MAYIILILLLLYVGSWLYDVFSINNEPSNHETGHSVERANTQLKISPTTLMGYIQEVIAVTNFSWHNTGKPLAAMSFVRPQKMECKIRLGEQYAIIDMYWVTGFYSIEELLKENNYPYVHLFSFNDTQGIIRLDKRLDNIGSEIKTVLSDGMTAFSNRIEGMVINEFGANINSHTFSCIATNSYTVVLTIG